MRNDGPRRGARPVLITGGAGFIGTNVALRLLSEGQRVTILDNLSRPGADRNLRWLRDQYGPQLRIEIGDVRDRLTVQRAVQGARQVFHFAAQVALTTSLLDPAHDFEVNARGTLNLLGAINSLPDPPSLVFTSTSRVYGAISDVRLVRRGTRYEPTDETVRTYGIGEDRPLDFRGPHGCSKGAADQYVLDYARTFGVPATVLRLGSCYGEHQFGSEEQGWVSHFLTRALRHEPVTLYGDGKQVRDVLFREDLVAALLLAQERIGQLNGHAFNLGGGPANATSLVEVLEHIGRLTGHAPKARYGDWRPDDQRYYVSDTRRFTSLTGWQPRVSVAEGLERLHRWLLGEAGIPERRRRVRGRGGRSDPNAVAVAAGC